MTEATKRITAILRRFVETEQEANWFYNTHSLPAIVLSAEARAKNALGLELAQTAERLLRSAEQWCGPHHKFVNQLPGVGGDDDNADQFAQRFQWRAFISVNVLHLQNLHRQVHENDGADLLLDLADEKWRNLCVVNFVNQAAEMIGKKLGLTVSLISEDEALEQMLVLLETYAAEYESLQSRSIELLGQAFAAHSGT
jgi:hypothetical protein